MKKCEICGAEFEKQGQLNLHKYHCRIKNNNWVGREKDQAECEHNWRFLNLGVPLEKRAHDNGYREVCSTCQTVKA